MEKQEMMCMTHCWTHNMCLVMSAIIIIANQIFITLGLKVIYFVYIKKLFGK